MSRDYIENANTGEVFKIGDEVVTTKAWQYNGKVYPVGHTGEITGIDGSLTRLNGDQNQRYYAHEIKHREIEWVRCDRSQAYEYARRPVVGDKIRVMGMEHTVTAVRGTWAQSLELEGVEYKIYIVPANKATAHAEVGELVVEYIEIAVPKPVRTAPTEEGIYATANQQLVSLYKGDWRDVSGPLAGEVLNTSWIVADEQWPLRKVVTTEV